MKPQYIFPLLLIALDIGAAVVYGVDGDEFTDVPCDAETLGRLVPSLREVKK